MKKTTCLIALHSLTNSTSRIVSLLALVLLSNIAQAITPIPATGLVVRITETGKISVSADGAGSVDSGGVAIQAEKPNAMATVRSAFLTCAGTSTIDDGQISLDGTPITWSDSVQNSFFNNVFADVTAIVKPKVDTAAPGLVDFIQTETNTSSVDGCGLYTIFDDPNQATDNTVFILFGGQDPTGDDFAVTLAEPLDPGNIAEMGLGISFSAQDQSGPAGSHLCGEQSAMFSNIDVNGTRLTSCAGNLDDGVGTVSNGLLITVGGIGDDPANPTDPFQEPADGAQPRITEDELYDLRPFLGATDTLIFIETINPSNDDNIFTGHIFLTSPAIAGAGVTLAPVAATNLPVGTDHTVTGTVVDDTGNPVQGSVVTFEIISGPNAGGTGTDTTDIDGQASFTYTGNGGPGTDSIQASVDDIESNIVTAMWVDAAAIPTLSNIAMILMAGLLIAIGLPRLVKRRNQLKP